MISETIKITDIAFLIGYVIAAYAIIELIVYAIKKIINKSADKGCDIGCEKCNMKKCPNNPNNNPPEE